MPLITRTQLRSSYDVIIVGAGSAGSIVAGKLSANPNINVLLIEGGKDYNEVIGVSNPNNINCLHDPTWPYYDPNIDWGYTTIPQTYMNNRKIPYSRAKMTGGCTAHNDMVYARGPRADFDDWAATYQCTGWNYDAISGYFDEVEDVMGPGRNAWTGFGQAFIDACVGLGLPEGQDYNSGGTMYGVFPLVSTITPQIVRITSYNEFVEPYLSRPNLEVIIHTEVNQILFDGNNNATGVQVSIGSEQWMIEAAREVVLSAGGINTPAILMRSGIGDAKQLTALGAAKIVSDLPGVGQNLQDALIFKGTWASSQPILGQTANEGYAIVWANMTDEGQPQNCIEMMCGNYTCDQPSAGFTGEYSITGGAMRLLSKGTVTLQSMDPSIAPVLDFNFYSDPADLDQAVAAFQLMRLIGNSSGLSAWRSAELVPGPGVITPEDIKEWILSNSWPYLHASGTCAMGEGQMAVCNPELLVYGVGRLSIADTSIMPRITSGHTQGPAFMIGAKAADMIMARIYG